MPEKQQEKNEKEAKKENTEQFELDHATISKNRRTITSQINANYVVKGDMVEEEEI